MGWRTPTSAERAQLTRIYGNEENWLNKSTETSKIRRAKLLTEKRRSKSAMTNDPGLSIILPGSERSIVGNETHN